MCLIEAVQASETFITQNTFTTHKQLSQELHIVILTVIPCMFDFGTSAKHIACCAPVDRKSKGPPIFLFLK
jgi:hypothetical protein